MEDGFEHAKAKAAWIKQFKCKGCRNDWWGVSNQCRNCHGTVPPVDFNNMLGVGWFECEQCNRKFAGFCRGNVRSACHRCGTKLFASFIVPGDKASAGGRDHHDCEACHGVGDCPIAAKARGHAARTNAPFWPWLT